MNNRWNKMIYKLFAPVYDKFFNSGMFLKARKQVFEQLSLSSEHSILFVGVGTGADLELLNVKNLNITAIDYSPAMLEKAQQKFHNTRIVFRQMDAQALQFEDESFDYVVASLIVSVVPDAQKCVQEMSRVLKPAGQLIVFDKFADEQQLSLPKKLLRPLISLLGTDIGRKFEDMVAGNRELHIMEDKPVMMNGMYRKIILTKQMQSRIEAASNKIR